MDRSRLLEILAGVSSGEMSADTAMELLADFPSACLGYAHLDTHRQLRRGIPETIYGEGKTPEQIEGIVQHLTDSGSPLLITRIASEAAQGVLARWPEADHDDLSRTLSIGSLPAAGGPPVMVVAAGTSDLPVAEEAARTLQFLGRPPQRAYDVGIAGLHRLASFRDEMTRAGVIIAVAGMEGALPSVVAGLVSVPVIGVPTSVGYGASLGGLTPLFTMLSSCACGLTVVNIDNGYGAAVAAHLMLGIENGQGEPGAR
ncbi:MAG: nickel pincer cofactor biosynthesis protein LarB [bacterium]|nr:MAG: nickel pincer cofactor biosynthesis protein LarB [bacterium]